MEKLQICKRTREWAAEALQVTLTKLFNTQRPFSEVDLREAWLIELRKNPDIFPDGWYIPPPHGVGAFFGSVEENSRLNYDSLRVQKMWPNNNIFFDDVNDLAYVYACIVDRKSGIIGDFCMTFYKGQDLAMQKHLAQTLKINYEIFDAIQVGMTLAQVYKLSAEVFAKHEMTNQIVSVTDPAGVNIGHTIPASYEDWNEEELRILQNAEADWKSVSSMISKKRKFVSPVEQLTLQKGMAFTLEPRLKNLHDPRLPLVSYHTIVAFHEDGSKELLTNFDEIFKLTGMNYMFQ